MSKTIFLLVSSAFLLDGKVAQRGDVVEVQESEAKDLLHRGKAVLAVLDPADQLDDAEGVPEGQEPAAAEQPAEEQPAEGEQAEQTAGEWQAPEGEQVEQPAAAEQPATPAPAKGKGNKKGK